MGIESPYVQRIKILKLNNIVTLNNLQFVYD